MEPARLEPLDGPVAPTPDRDFWSQRLGQALATRAPWQSCMCQGRCSVRPQGMLAIRLGGNTPQLPGCHPDARQPRTGLARGPAVASSQWTRRAPAALGSGPCWTARLVGEGLELTDLCDTKLAWLSIWMKHRPRTPRAEEATGQWSAFRVLPRAPQAGGSWGFGEARPRKCCAMGAAGPPRELGSASLVDICSLHSGLRDLPVAGAVTVFGKIFLADGMKGGQI